MEELLFFFNRSNGQHKCLKNLFKYLICLFVTVPFYNQVCAQLTADFTATAVSGCTPLSIQFTDKSTGGPTSWYWDFGNGSNSNSPAPTITYTNPGSYTVKLFIKNSAGQNYIVKNNYITVSATPQVSFTQSVSSGCLPLGVTFTNTSDLFGASIKNWIWNFGDGSTSNAQSPSYTYTTRGSFDVSLAAETIDGCVDTFVLKGAVKAGNQLGSVSFKAIPLDGCASALRKFTDMSTGLVNSWNWDFGDGGSSNLKNPSYHFTDTGWFDVKLKVGDNGCEDSITYKKFIHIIGPVAKIFKYVKCTNPYEVFFYDQSIGAQNWQWDFGDGGTSDLKNTSHIYNSTGIYNAKLTVSANACTDTTNYTIYIINQKPSYTIDTLKNSYCRNDSIHFIATNYDSSLVYYFSWSFDGGLTRTPFRFSNSEIKNVYVQNGNYSAPILYIYNKENCFDTIQEFPIKISGPIADFKNSSATCIGDSINFLDQSTSAGSIINRQWSFDDGDSIITNSSQTNYKFPFLGLYNVLFKVTDVNGCTDTISHTINIADTPTIDAGEDTFLCQGKSVTFQPSGGVSYTWDNNPFLSCTNCSNPVATPTDTTEFYVTGKNADGCAARDSLIINVEQKKQVSVNPKSGTVCAGNPIQLSAIGYDNFTWTPSETLSNANIANPTATPLTSTVYTVTSTDKAGCFSQSASANIIANPNPTVNIIDTSVTIAPGGLYQINATYSADVVKWEWQPAQWLSDATIANPTASPLQTTTYIVNTSTANGCVSSGHITITVVCDNTIVFIPNTFSPNGDGMNDYFYPRSPGALKIKSLKIFNRWGQEVFKKDDFFTNDQSSGWNGKYKGVAEQSDVYPYIITFLCTNGTTFSEKGSITLLR